MRYHLFQKFFGKMVKMKETSFLLSKCLVSIAHHCNAYSVAYAVVFYAEFAYTVAYDFLELNIGVVLCLIWQLGLRVFSILFLNLKPFQIS